MGWTFQNIEFKGFLKLGGLEITNEIVQITVVSLQPGQIIL